MSVPAVDQNLLLPWGGDVPNPAVYFTAHQDDEALTLGPDIENHVNAGRTVYIVLCTDGRNSNAKALLEKKLGRPVSAQEFSQARTRELLAAANQLGVAGVYIMPGYDGGLTSWQADAISSMFIDRWPGASFKCQSDRDSHPDHAAMGKAFRRRLNEHPSLDVRFILKRDDWDIPGALVGCWQAFGGERTRNALRQYQVWDPANGRYGIGYLSVPGSFDDALRDTRTYLHK